MHEDCLNNDWVKNCSSTRGASSATHMTEDRAELGPLHVLEELGTTPRVCNVRRKGKPYRDQQLSTTCRAYLPIETKHTNRFFPTSCQRRVKTA